MRYAEWVDFERFERKRFSGLENFPVRTPWQLGLDRLDGVPVAKIGNLPNFESPLIPRMIIMFVCEKNSAQILDRNAFLAKQKLKLLAGEPASIRMVCREPAKPRVTRAADPIF